MMTSATRRMTNWACYGWRGGDLTPGGSIRPQKANHHPDAGANNHRGPRVPVSKLVYRSSGPTCLMVSVPRIGQKGGLQLFLDVRDRDCEALAQLSDRLAL